MSSSKLCPFAELDTAIASWFTALGHMTGYEIHLAFELQPHPTTIPLVRFDNIFCAAAEMPRNGQKRHVSTNNSVTRVAQPKQKISLAHLRAGHRPAKSQLVSPAQSRTRSMTKNMQFLAEISRLFPIGKCADFDISAVRGPFELKLSQALDNLTCSMATEFQSKRITQSRMVVVVDT